jgi:transcriptional regulator with XRE-family HTH domain
MINQNQKEKAMKLDQNRVRAARERLGLSRADLAERAEISPNSAVRAEKAQEIRPLTARRIARALGVEVADLYPKGPAPNSSPKPEAGDARRIIDMPSEDFRQTLASTSEAGDEALIELYSRLDAERIASELDFRADEDNRTARSDYARAVERRMLLFLTLLTRGVTLPDPEQLSHQVEQLEELELLR